MFGIVAIDVLIGLVTIYLVFALACTAIVEAFSSMLDVRSTKLEAALKELFAGDLSAGKPFVTAFYDHPMIQSLSQGPEGRPSYIPADVVGRVVQSLLLKNESGVSLKDAIDALPDTFGPSDSSPDAADKNRIKELFKTILSQGQQEVQSFRTAVETHFDAVMDRASGWVKRRQQKVALCVAAALVLFANIDTIDIANALYTNPALRNALVAQAEETVKKVSADTSPPGQPTIPPSIETSLSEPVSSDDPLAKEKRQLQSAIAAYDNATSTMKKAGLQFGWNRMPTDAEWPLKVVGLLISTFAIALGAPFWFDVLKRFMKVRQSGASPNEKKS